MFGLKVEGIHKSIRDLVMSAMQCRLCMTFISFVFGETVVSLPHKNDELINSSDSSGFRNVIRNKKSNCLQKNHQLDVICYEEKESTNVYGPIKMMHMFLVKLE